MYVSSLSGKKRKMYVSSLSMSILEEEKITSDVLCSCLISINVGEKEEKNASKLLSHICDIKSEYALITFFWRNVSNVNI